MQKQKDGADCKKKQKDKDKKKNDEKKPNKKGSKKDKYKLDPKATGGPTARCPKCPNALSVLSVPNIHKYIILYYNVQFQMR